MTNFPAKRTDLQPVEDDAIRFFFGLDPITTVLNATNYRAADQLERLITIARGDDDDAAMKAMRDIRSLLKESGTLNGLIGQTTITKKDQNDGTSTETRTLRLRGTGSPERDTTFESHNRFTPPLESSPEGDPEGP